MAAKLLQSLADENPDLQKQIGCMTGIFQIFDRHHVISGKRVTRKRLPPGNSNFGNEKVERQSNNSHYQQNSSDFGLSKNVSDKQRLSTESSRASFSSACSSSASSVDFDKSSHQEVSSSYDRIIFPETSSRDPTMSHQSNTSPRLGRHSLDLRDVVKDAMYREARCLSVKTPSREESTNPGTMLRDSPRQSSHADLNESLRVLAKLREAPWYYNETREQLRSVYDSREASPRFSYDGRENNRMSLDSRETIKSTIKLKELPRLSLDSRESSIRGSTFDSKLSQLSRISKSEKDHYTIPKSSAGPNRPTSVVAKLMGLDTLPESSAGNDSEFGLATAVSGQYGGSSTKPLKLNNLKTPIHTSNSSRSLVKDATSPRWRNADLIMKPISSSRVPIEPAPWKMHDGNRSSQKMISRRVKIPLTPPTNSSPSVYSEIEKRLKDLEFKQSGKDLRALKQILEAMQAKGLLESSKEEQASNFGTKGNGNDEQRFTNSDFSLRSTSQRNQQSSQSNASTVTNSRSSRAFESPIVIMKPAKLVDKSGTSSSRTIENGKNAPKDQSPRYNRRDASVINDKKGSSRNVKPAHSSSRAQQNPVDSAKGSGSVSPRLQQKKQEAEKRSRPPTPPSSTGLTLTKPRRQTNRQSAELTSPAGRSRPKYATNSQQCDDQLSEVSNESKTLSCPGDEASLLSDAEVTSELIQRKSSPRPEEEDFSSELAPEHPSPVSVLDTDAYKDDEPSPVKQITAVTKGNAARDSDIDRCEDLWRPASDMSRKKLENIDNLVQKLRRLNSSHDEARTDYIASLCENANPDDRYISEILLASGLLLRDLGSGLTTFQLHPSGHPINPELFFVLEQTKASGEERSGTEKGTAGEKKLHRRLVFDSVNEVLARKLSSVGATQEPRLRPGKLAKVTLNAQKLLRELCREIERLQTKKLELGLEDDSVKAMLSEDVMLRSGNWVDFSGEVSGMVLDVERLIFKELVDEVVRGEAVNIRVKPGRRRQLFAGK